MATIDIMSVSIIYITALVILLIGYLTAISSKDLIRLLIALELMFGSVFLFLIPLFYFSLSLSNSAFGIAIITIFTSCSEFIVLIAAITIFDKLKKNIYADSVTIGGEKL